MEVPTIIKTWVDSDGVTVYTVQYKDGSTCDMTVQQYDYLKASAEAIVKLDSQQDAQDDSSPEASSSGEPAQNITESPDLREDYVPQEEELPFEGSLTAYDDRAADTPALYANLPNVSNSFTAIMDWFEIRFLSNALRRCTSPAIRPKGIPIVVRLNLFSSLMRKIPLLPLRFSTRRLAFLLCLLSLSSLLLLLGLKTRFGGA